MKGAALYPRFGKRVCDWCLALLALLALSPLLAGIAVLVRWRLGGTVLFTQDRVGRGGTIFRIYKFRTMTDQRDVHGQLLPDSQRLTPLGQFLRKASLDELPELWNVLRGEMSLVGPRPLLPEYLEHYTPDEARRHEATPGLTGWAQINGRNAISWEQRFQLDVWYVDHVSPWLDLKILALTVCKVFTQHGVSAEGHATMPKFSRSPAASLNSGKLVCRP